MPYIKVSDRLKLDKEISDLAAKIETSGELNYVITKLLHQQVAKKGICYETLNSLMGVLSCATIEFYRKVVVPYEEVKIRENGDV